MSRIIDMLLSGDIEYGVLEQRYQEYHKYIQSIRDQLGPGAYAYATGPYHLSGSEEAPHDSWFDTLSISATQSDRATGSPRGLDLHLRLFGSYHNGFIEFHYKNVREYSLVNVAEWRYDEICLSSDGYVLHEIAFDAASRWIIEAEDFTYTWIPKGP